MWSSHPENRHSERASIWSRLLSPIPNKEQALGAERKVPQEIFLLVPHLGLSSGGGKWLILGACKSLLLDTEVLETWKKSVLTSLRDHPEAPRAGVWEVSVPQCSAICLH